MRVLIAMDKEHSNGPETFMNAPHMPVRPRAADDVIAFLTSELTSRLGDRVATSATVREQHGHSLTWVKNQPPDVVVYPRTTEEVSDIVKLCAAHGVPVIPFGTGTSLEGHINAPYGGVSVDVSLMKRIIAVHDEDLDCVVEAGVTRKELNEHLRDKGLFFPIDPISAGICPFPSVKAACDAVIMTIQSGIPVARIELLDELQVRAVNLHSKLTLPESPLLLLEFHGTEAGVQEQAERFGDIAAEFSGGPFEWATRPEERSRLWQARHDSYWAAKGLRPGVQSVATDVCVPISRLAECVDETKRDILESGLIAPIVGHVGDGNFHVQPLVDMDNPAEVAACEAFVDRLVKRALAMEGTCTGEHGVGQKKMKYLEIEHGPAALDLMRVLKQAIDPHNIMNPGKIGTL
jgi:FAD/FMN-containing dehydrogenase